MSLKIKNDDFTAKLVGRGIWHFWHSVGFASKNREDVISLYHTILIYNKVIRCLECYEHSNKDINDTSDEIISVLKNDDLTDTEVIDFFNRWLYKYHCNANIHAGKNIEEFPTYEDVAEFYLNFEFCTSDCDK